MTYTEEDKKDIINRVCEYIVENKESVRSALKLSSMPNRDTFYKWIRENEDFADQYARACSDRADELFEEILEIADSDSDVFYDEEGNKRVDAASVQKKRVMIDSRKWMLGKMNPTKYGEKVKQELEHKGEIKIVREIKK